MRDKDSRLGLQDLPVELVAEIYLMALDPSLPIICKHTYSAAKSFAPSVHAQYLLGRHPYTNDFPDFFESGHFSAIQLRRILRYPICTLPVFQSMCRIELSVSRGHGIPGERGPSVDYPLVTYPLELPRRWFRRLDDHGAEPLGPDSEPLPFLRFLWDRGSASLLKELRMPPPSPDSCGGYPLVRAVHARFTPLVQFLLDHGADPAQRECMAIKMAIGRRDLSLVKMLMDVPPDAHGLSRFSRVPIKPKMEMLNFAVKMDARDIVRYLMEKGCPPDMETMEILQSRTTGKKTKRP